MKNLSFTLSIISVLFSFSSNAQIGIINEVVAVVGENIVTKAEWETEYLQVAGQYEDYKGDLKCEVLNQSISQKLLLHWAEIDSVIVADERIDGELNRRIAYYASQIGGEDRLETYLGKSIIEYKNEIRPKIKEQLTVQEMQSTILGAVKVTPTEIRKYFNNIPKDSLPLFDAEVEVAQIVVKPKPSQLAKDYALKSIQKIRRDIMAGTSDFETIASISSDDIGSRKTGGDLGFFSRGQMVAAFERAAFKLKPDSISPVVETEFGYHIIQMIERRGEKIRARHILIKPLIVRTDLTAAKASLNNIVSEIKNEEITFCKAVEKYSEDEMTKASCGYFTDPALGSTQQEITSLDPTLVVVIENMEPGSFTRILEYPQPDGSMAYRVIFLKTKTMPHTANLKQDYQKIQAFALERKKQEALEEWVAEHKNDTYIKIDKKYRSCAELSRWIVN